MPDKPRRNVCPVCGGDLPDPLLIAVARYLNGNRPASWEVHHCPGPMVRLSGT